jgi:hypothetical protein
MRRIEDALRLTLTLEDHDLLVDALKTTTFVFDSISEPSALWTEFLEMAISEAVDDQTNDQIESLVLGLRKRAKLSQE